MIEIVVAGKPMGKQRVRFSRDTGRAFTPERTVSYEGRIAYAAQQAMAGRPPLAGAIVVDMVVRVPIPASWPKRKQAAALSGELRPLGKPDWDNFGKIFSDGLNLVVWADDAQIVDGRVRKFYSDQPGVTIRVDNEQPNGRCDSGEHGGEEPSSIFS